MDPVKPAIFFALAVAAVRNVQYIEQSAPRPTKSLGK